MLRRSVRSAGIAPQGNEDADHGVEPKTGVKALGQPECGECEPSECNILHLGTSISCWWRVCGTGPEGPEFEGQWAEIQSKAAQTRNL